jgi:hypothetical protein
MQIRISAFVGSLVVTVVAAGCRLTTDSEDDAPQDRAPSGSAAAAQSGSDSSGACARVIDYSRMGTTACKACKQTSCSRELTTGRDLASSCERQWLTAMACKTCGCYENAITNAALCKQPLDSYLSCIADNCEAPCR